MPASPAGAARPAGEGRRGIGTVGLGLCASFFFAFTFVLNRRMNLGGGSWMWSAALRFTLMLPMLLVLVVARGEFGGLAAAIARRPLEWLLWSTVGFGLFYSFLCAASAFGPSWLVAATWQVTIVAGMLLSPLFFDRIPDGGGFRLVRHRLPRRPLAASTIILAGIGIMQWREAAAVSPGSAVASAALVLVAAFSYPLGNRKMMELCDGGLTTTQRVCGMALCSMPFWIVLGAVAAARRGLPGGSQVLQSFLVALFSGVTATLIFFKATDLARRDMRLLAAVESTQSGEVVFSLFGGLLILEDRPPSALALAGLGLVVIGMVASALSRGRPAASGEGGRAAGREPSVPLPRGTHSDRGAPPPA